MPTCRTQKETSTSQQLEDLGNNLSLCKEDENNALQTSQQVVAVFLLFPA